MAIIKTPVQLKNEILSRLGSPVITVEVTEDQIYRCIDRAIELFVDYHPEGSVKFYGLCTLTATEASTGVLQFTKPFTAVTAVLRPTGDASVGWYDGAIFDAFWHQNQDIVESMRGGSSCPAGTNRFDNQMSYWQIWNDYMETFRTMFNPQPDFHFNQHRNQLKIFDSYLLEDQVIAIEGYVSSTAFIEQTALGSGQTTTEGNQTWDNPLTHSGTVTTPTSPVVTEQQYFTQATFNDRWLKDMATAFVREQWGQNLSKYDGQQLPGGVTVNAERIIERAQNDIEKLREELIQIEAPLGVWLV